MDDLISKLRQYAQADDLHIDERTTLLEAAAALEAAREDDDLLTIAYMSGQHDGRKEAQQTAAVDGKRSHYMNKQWVAEWCDDHGIELTDDAHRELLDALAGQQGERG